MPEILLPFGVKAGVLVDVSQVESGLACGCVCPSCGSSLIARKGRIKVHHFGHHSGAECPTALETALHLAAKQVLDEQKKIAVPPVEVKFDSYRSHLLLFPARQVELDQVRLEARTGNVVPDVLALTSGRQLFIEIRVTHRVDEDKHEKIRQLGISAVEIDLSTHVRHFSLAGLAESLVRETAHKQWLFNAKAERVKAMFLRTGERKSIVERGLALHVDHCPVGMRDYRGKAYANVIDDCVHCDYALEISTDLGTIVCGGRHRIATLEQLWRFHKE